MTRLLLPAALLLLLIVAPHPLLASTGRSPDDPHVSLDVVHGSGSGSKYRKNSSVSISANNPSGTGVFLGWIKLSEGDGQIADAYSPSTTFHLGEDNAKVTAVFAELEKTWFPPGPEDNTKGILLPKPKGQDKPTRLQHAFRVKITADENAPMDTIRGLFEVQLKWEQDSHAKFFDKKEGGQSLSSSEPLPADLLKQDDQNQQNLKAILYYEGAYNPEDHETPPTVQLTLTLKPKKTTSSSPQTLSASLLPIEMKVVDRDDPTRKWGDEKDHNASKPIYAGESTGDMVSWKLAGTDNWTNVTFTWTAEGPGEETITGPSGPGKNEWTINDADDDTATDWLNWKPGEWTIKVQIGSSQAEFTQEVGVRTEEYFVVGTIPVEPEDTTGVSVDTINNWACPKILYSIGATIGGGINSQQSSVYVPMDEPHRVYVNHRLLNSTRNFDPAPSIKPETPIKEACGLSPYKHYRWFAGCQFRFRVNDDTLAAAPQFVGDNKADLVGFTPLPCSQSNAAGFIGEKHPDSGKVTGQAGDAEFSYLTKNRAGKGGQVGFKNLNGRELPWVFFRFRFEAKDDGLIDTRFENGASSAPNGPDAKDYSTVPTMIVYRRYYDLQESKWKIEQIEKLDEDRRTFFSIGNPVSGAPYVLP